MALSTLSMEKITRLAPDEKGRKRISVFLRGGTYYARFRITNRIVSKGALYVTETMKTGSLEEAGVRAFQRLLEIRVAEKSGLTIKSTTVSDEIDAFIRHYEEGLEKGLSGFSKNMLRGFRKTICRYWREYVGNKPLAEISLPDLEHYEDWRSGYWERWAEKEALKRSVRRNTDGTVRLPSNARYRASARTIQWETNAFKQFLSWCEKRGKYAGNAHLFLAKKNLLSRRSAFTPAEYTRLTSAMRRKSWISQAGKHGNDTRLLRYRKMLRAYVLFMANTGLRVGEARNLRWSDITFHENRETRQAHCKVWVAQSYSKVQKRREVIGMPKAAEVMQEFKTWRQKEKDSCGKDDFIWCDERGRPIGDFREGFNRLLKDANVELDPDGRKHTIYSLRHHYITERLREGVPIYALASNCGTSVAMIERYYSDARPADFVGSLTKSRWATPPKSAT